MNYILFIFLILIIFISIYYPTYEKFYIINNIKDQDCLSYLNGANTYNFGEDKKIVTFADKKYSGGNCKKIAELNQYDLPKQCCYKKEIQKDRCSKYKTCSDYLKSSDKNNPNFTCGQCQLDKENILLEGTLYGPMQIFSAYCKPGTLFDWKLCDQSYDLNYQLKNY